MPTCVWMNCGESGVGSSFFRRVTMNTRREAISLSQLRPQMLCVIYVCVRTFPVFFARRQSNLNSIGVSFSGSSFRNAHPAG